MPIFVLKLKNFMGCDFLCNFYDEKFSSSTNFIYLLPKILNFFYKIKETLRGTNLKLKKKLKTQGKNSRSGRIFPHLRYQVVLKKKPALGNTTLLSMMKAKHSQQRYWPCHENGLIKRQFQRYLYLSFISASPYYGLG